MGYNNYNRRGGGGNYQNGGGGKDYKADPIKQFLISRGSSRDRAVELCIAGKIELEQIPEYTDKLTLIQFGHIHVDDAVDREILRIAARLTRKKEEAPKQEEKPQAGELEDLCQTCSFGPNGTEECGVGCDDTASPIYKCQEYDDGEGQEEPPATDEQAEADQQREQEQAQRQAEEDKASEPAPSGPPARGRTTKVHYFTPGAEGIACGLPPLGNDTTAVPENVTCGNCKKMLGKGKA